VISREQLHLLGVSDQVTKRLLRERRWQSLAQGIYHTIPSDPTWHGLAWAGAVLGGGARLGPQASGFLHNLVDEAPRPVDVLVPAGRSARVGGEWRFSRERPGGKSGRSVGAPPRLECRGYGAGSVGGSKRGRSRRIDHQGSPAADDDTSSAAPGGGRAQPLRWFLIRAPASRWVISPAVACLSGLKSAPRKRVRGNPPRVQIPPPPPA
jgi:hypothetical protein